MHNKNLELKLRIPKGSISNIILQRISSCQKSNNEIVNFPAIFSKLCVSLQLPKKDVWELLFFLNDLSIITIVPGHGVKPNYKFKEMAK